MSTKPRFSTLIHEDDRTYIHDRANGFLKLPGSNGYADPKDAKEMCREMNSRVRDGLDPFKGREEQERIPRTTSARATQTAQESCYAVLSRRQLLAMLQWMDIGRPSREMEMSNTICFQGTVAKDRDGKSQIQFRIG